MSNLAHDPSFPFYVASRLMSQAYRKPLDEIGLTYPQYLVMLVLWEKDAQTVSGIGDQLQLDSGTLTPLLKRLEASNLIKRVRSEEDERKVVVELTYPGKSLQTKASGIPKKIKGITNSWEDKELKQLNSLMERMIKELNSQE